MGSSRSTDVKNFGRILKNCLDLTNTVRQCDISSLYHILCRISSCLCSPPLALSLSFFSLSLSFFEIRDKPLKLPG